MKKELNIDDAWKLRSEVRHMAIRLLRGKYNLGSLEQPTDLMVRAFVKLASQKESFKNLTWDNRDVFFAHMYQAMRRIIQDQIKHRTVGKRDFRRNVSFDVGLGNFALMAEERPESLEALLCALEEVEDSSDEHTKSLIQVINHRYFGDHTYQEIAALMELTLDKVRTLLTRAHGYFQQRATEIMNTWHGNNNEQ